MNLRSGSPYWLFHTPLLHTYNTLKQNIKTDIVVIGAGISGALAAYELVKAGHSVCIVSDKHAGVGSTVASTGLLQYEIDTPLYQLIDKTGKETAVRSYQLCADSIDTLKTIHRKLGIAKYYQARKSLLLASVQKDVSDLRKEYEARKQMGLNVQWLNKEEILNKFGFEAPGAIYSAKGAQINAYLLTQQLIHWCAQKGAQVYDKVEVKDIKHIARLITLVTDEGYEITAKYAVMATGYEAVKWVDKKVAALHSTYAIISEPFDKKQLWNEQCLIWETDRPYNYFRTTTDNRVIVGGLDEPFSSPGKRDKLITTKSKQLQKTFQRKFPHLQFNIEHAWAGTFAETPDGLPYIGTTKKLPRVIFALGYGGNGITFSQIASKIIRDIVSGKNNPDSHRFRFNRPSAKP